MYTGWTEAELNATKMGVVRELIRRIHVEARQSRQQGGMAPPPRTRGGRRR